MQQVSPVLEEDAVFETQILEAKHLIDGVGSRGQGGWVGVWEVRLLARLSQVQNLSPSCCSIAGRRAGWGRSRAARRAHRRAF